MSKLEAAVEYAEKGYYVVPLCWPNPDGTCGCGKGHERKDVGKAPLIPVWQEARADVAQVREWWTRWPEANIGVLLKPSGVVVLDADDALAVSKVLERSGGYGWHVWHTGGGGHWYYRRTDDCPAIRATKVDGNLDILGAGYVVGVGSVHRDGQRYTADALVPRVDDLPPVPGWVVQVLQERQETVPTAVDRLTMGVLPGVDLDSLRIPSRIKELIREGWRPDNPYHPSRSEACMAAIRALVRAYLSDAQIAAVMLDRENGISERYYERTEEQRLKLIAYEIGKARLKAQGETEIEDEETPAGPRDLKEELNVRMLFEHVPEQQTWLIQDVLPVGLTMVVGQSRAGKSLLCHELAASLALGQPFLGHEVIGGPYRVLYLIHPLEGLMADVQDHFRALGVTEETQQNLWFGYGYYTKKVLTDKVVQLVAQEQFDVVFLDTIGKFVQMDREGGNDYSLVNTILNDVVGGLRKHVKAVVALTHQSRYVADDSPTRNAIGSVAWGAASQASLGMRRVEEHDEDPVYVLTIEPRYGQKRKLTLALVDKRFEITEHVTRDDRQEMIRQFFRENEGEWFSRSQLLEALLSRGLNVTETTLARDLAQLVKSGEVRKTGSTRSVKYAYVRYKVIQGSEAEPEGTELEDIR